MKRPGNIWFVILVTAALVLLNQCSPYAGKGLLHFFFDGVPESDTTSLLSENPEGIMPDSSTYSEGMLASSAPSGLIHYPYGEGECSSCHNERALGIMVETQPGLCYICHEDLAVRYSYLHGPVAGGYCTACHDPHRSENEKLLKLTDEVLCFYCHEAKSVLGNEMHEDLDGMLCTDCHNPHGGEDKYIFQ